MRFSLNWLKEFVDIEVSAKKLAEKLTLAGFEVESITYFGQELKNVITGKITKIEKHPNADKLVITQIFDGTKTHQIITGATNVFEDAIVPVSLPGAVLAGGFEIKNAVLRGIDSFGMLCSQKELGIVEEAQGIWILPKDTPLGKDVADYFGLKDAVLEVAILPNRGDCQSIIGLAREIAVILDKKLKMPKFKLKKIEEKINFKLKNSAPNLCLKYTGRIIKNIKIKPSPFDMQIKLLHSGIRPINNIVDITNYILLEYGQPLHAFDLSLLDGPKIVVRTANAKETITTLDGQKHNLLPSDLLICDAKKTVALAGVMGGKNSQILNTTKDVLLESAFFIPATIRKTSQKLGLRTESSIRFERGVDFNLVEQASDKAAYMIQNLAEGRIIKQFFSDINKKSNFSQAKKINFSADKINELLGKNYPYKEIISVLEKLGFSLSEDKKTIEVPSWRKNDVSEIPCLAEEAARILGYDQIPVSLPKNAIAVMPETQLEKLVSQTESIIHNFGFYAIKTFTMVSEEDILNLGQTTLKLKNPLTPKEAIMRFHLLASLLKCLANNVKRQIENIKIYEIGKIFIDDKNNKLPLEEIHFQALIFGQINKYAFTSEEKANNTVNLRYLRGIAEAILAKFNLKNIDFMTKESLYLHPVKNLTIFANKEIIGEIGFIHPNFSAKYDITVEIGSIMLNMSKIAKLKTDRKSYKPFSKFPHTRRDLAILAPKNLLYKDIAAIIDQNKPKDLQEYFLFDYFESEKIGSDKKSLAFGFIYQSYEETLKDEVVNKRHEQFVAKLKEKLPIEIR